MTYSSIVSLNKSAWMANRTCNPGGASVGAASKWSMNPPVKGSSASNMVWMDPKRVPASKLEIASGHWMRNSHTVHGSVCPLIFSSVPIAAASLRAEAATRFETRRLDGGVVKFGFSDGGVGAGLEPGEGARNIVEPTSSWSPFRGIFSRLGRGLQQYGHSSSEN